MPGRSSVSYISDFSGGWNSNTDITLVRDNQLIDVANADFDQFGKVVMRPGTERIGLSTGALPGTGAFVFRDSAGTEHALVRFGGVLYETTNPDLARTVALTTIASGLSAQFTRFTQMNGKVFMANGVDNVKEWTGSGALADSSGMPGGGAQPFWEIKHYENRLYGVPNNQKNKLYYSVIGNPNDFSGSGSGSIQFPEDGYTITNVEVGEGALLVSRGDAGVWAVTFPSGSTTPAANKTPAFRGAVGRGACTQYENVALYLSSDAIRVAGQLPNFPSGIRSNGISEDIQNTILSLPISASGLANAHYFKGKLFIAVPLLNSSYNDTIITIVNSNGAFSKYPGINAAQIFNWRGYLYFTDSRTGQLWRFNPTLKSDDISTPIRFLMVTKHLNFSNIRRQYIGDMVPRFRADPATDLTFSWAIDFSAYAGVYNVRTTPIQSQGEPAPEFGNQELYFGSNNATFGGSSVLNDNLVLYQRRISINSPCYYVSVKIEQNVLNKKVEFISLGFEWKAGADNDYGDIN